MRCASTFRSSDRCSMRAMHIRDIDVPPDMQPSSTGFLRMLGNDNNRNNNKNEKEKKRKRKSALASASVDHGSEIELLP